MFTLEPADVVGLDWKPRNYRIIENVQYGYDKAFHPKLQTPVPGGIIDLVRVQPNHVIYDHYHPGDPGAVMEVFVSLGGLPALFQTRKRSPPGERRDEKLVLPGSVFTIYGDECHRVVNHGEMPLYLVRFAAEGKESIVVEPGWA